MIAPNKFIRLISFTRVRFIRCFTFVAVLWFFSDLHTSYANDVCRSFDSPLFHSSGPTGGKLTIIDRNSSKQRTYDFSDSDVRNALSNYVNSLDYECRKYLIDFLTALGQGKDIKIEVGDYGDSYYASYTRLPNGFSCLSAEENQKLFQKERGTIGRLLGALTNSAEYQVIRAVYNLGQFYYFPPVKIDERQRLVNSGDSKYNSKDYWGAIEDYSKAVDSGLRNYDVFFKRATSYFALEFFNNAIDDYTNALSYKKTEEAFLYRGLSKFKVGDGSCIDDLMAGGTRGKAIAKELGVSGAPSSGQGAATSSKYRASGTGFFIDPRGYVCTNDHVISGMNEIDVFVTRNGKTDAFRANCILHDKTNDIAILKIIDSRFKTLPSIPYSLGSGTKDVGSKVFAMGYPELSFLGEEIKVTDGIISSRTGYQGDATTYQISAPIQHGNSGGPLFDNNGSVIGITNAGIESLQNVGYAIKISYLKMLVADSPERIILPSSNQISSLSFTEKIKKISPYVVIIKTYYTTSTTQGQSSRPQTTTTSSGTSPSTSQKQSLNPETDSNKDINLSIGDVFQITTHHSIDRWSSTDDSIATVSQSGLVVAKSPGRVTVFARHGANFTTYSISVYSKSTGANKNVTTQAPSKSENRPPLDPSAFSDSEIVAVAPNVRVNKSASTKIEKIAITKSHTIVEISFRNEQDKNYWGINSNKTYILADGKKYMLIKKEGIPLAPNRTSYLVKGEVATFRLYFAALPNSVSMFDLIEDDPYGWGWYGISIRERMGSSSIGATEQTSSTSSSSQTRQSLDSNVSSKQKPSGIISGYEYVDLGLSVKWATRNVGAKSESEYGDFFAWGEIKQKQQYRWDNYIFTIPGNTWDVHSLLNKYILDDYWGKVDNKTELEKSDDAARKNWGRSWRLPTETEMNELREKCVWTWTSQGGVSGYKITGKNGNSIFLPASGYMSGSNNSGNGTRGYYWTSSLNTTGGSAQCIIFNPSDAKIDSCDRYRGCSIRPVSE